MAGTDTIPLNNTNNIRIADKDTLYIADSMNYRIVVMSLRNTSNITTFGSGPGSNPDQFGYPTDMFILPVGIYVLDSGNGRVMRWLKNFSDPRNLTRKSLFSSSYSMFIGKLGNLYISENMNHRVISYRVNFSNATVVSGTGVSGTAPNQLNSPRGIFVDDNYTIYVVDKGNHRVQKWPMGSTPGITVAGTGVSGGNLSQLSYPNALIVDADGNMFIADGGNNRIVKWSVNATEGICIVPCTSNPWLQLSSPVSLAFDSERSLYVADYNTHRVLKFQIVYDAGEESEQRMS